MGALATSHLPVEGSNLPLPIHYRNYLINSNRIVHIRNPSVSQLLADDMRYDTVEEVQHAANKPCQCANLVGTLVSHW